MNEQPAENTSVEETATSEVVEWPTESEATGKGEHELWAEAMDRIDNAPKPNRAQRRANARQYMGRATRQQLHGFGRWRKGR